MHATRMGQDAGTHIVFPLREKSLRMLLRCPRISHPVVYYKESLRVIYSSWKHTEDQAWSHRFWGFML